MTSITSDISNNIIRTLPVTLEDSLIVRKPQLPSKEEQIIQELEDYIQEYSNYEDGYDQMKRKMKEILQLPKDPCYVIRELYDKTGKLVHIVGKGEFSGLDENGNPMLLYDKRGLPKNVDGSVRRFTIQEIMEIQKTRREENVPSNLPRKPRLSKRKTDKKRKTLPKKKLMDSLDDMVAKESERLRKINEMM